MCEEYITYTDLEQVIMRMNRQSQRTGKMKLDHGKFMVNTAITEEDKIRSIPYYSTSNYDFTE